MSNSKQKKSDDKSYAQKHRHYERVKRDMLKERYKVKPLEDIIPKQIRELRKIVAMANAVTPHADHIKNETLRASLIKACSDMEQSLSALRTAIDARVEKELNTPMLALEKL